MATATLPMPKVPMGFWCPEEEVLPRMRYFVADASDNPTDAELTELKSFWMWEPVQEKWDYIRDWEEHKRKAIEQHARRWRAASIKAEETSGPRTRWIQ